MITLMIIIIVKMIIMVTTVINSFTVIIMTLMIFISSGLLFAAAGTGLLDGITSKPLEMIKLRQQVLPGTVYPQL